MTSDRLTALLAQYRMGTRVPTARYASLSRVGKALAPYAPR